MSATVLEFRIMTTELESYPNRIRELRKACGMTQQALGDAIGATSVHVGHLELGRREASLPMLRAIARALGVATADLLSVEDNPLAATPRGQRLLTHWNDADEPGRQAIERVAETMAGYKAEDGGQAPDRIAPPPREPDATRGGTRRRA